MNKASLDANRWIVYRPRCPCGLQWFLIAFENAAKIQLLGRPTTVVPWRSYVLLLVFLSFFLFRHKVSELPRPITANIYVTDQDIEHRTTW